MALTKYNFNSFDVTPVAGRGLAFDADADGFTTATPGAMTLIKTTTLSSAATSISFVNGASDVVLDGTYNTYLFKFINIHPANDDVFFEFNGSDDTSSHAYNITKTTTNFSAEHNEGDSTAQLGYVAGDDLAQGTGYQRLLNGIGNDNDGSCAGELFLFSPASTTFVKHFIARIPGHRHSSAALDSYVAGYFNTTAAITALDFKMSGGNIDLGTIKMYGISK